jgi:hypothetical protein
MKSTGGYFGLELRAGEHEHRNAIMLNTARNCLEYILLAKQYAKIYIPYYTCEVIIEPLKRNRIDFEFYHVNELLEPAKTYRLSANEAFLYTNYFGFKNEAVKQLSGVYGKQLVIDSAQAFFARPLEEIDTFYSARKFLGVADGGFLYTDRLLNKTFEQDMSFDRMSHLLKRIDISAEAAFLDFRKNDDSLKDTPIKEMSKLTEHILRGIDYQTVKEKRMENFRVLDSELKKMNRLPIDFSCNDSVPMVYPFWGNDDGLKQRLIAQKVYVATFWSNVFDWCREKDMDYVLAKNIIPLPIDQRYGKEDMQRIIDVILN